MQAASPGSSENPSTHVIKLNNRDHTNFLMFSPVISDAVVASKLTDSVKYDFSDLQIKQAHGTTWVFRD